MTSASRHNREIELKLAVPAEATRDLLDAIRARLTDPAHIRLVTTYFDTTDQALARAGISLRVRRSGGTRTQTLKGNRAPGVAADRAEWNWPIDQDTPDLSLLSQTPVAASLQAALDLHPTVVSDIARTVSLLHPDDDTTIEAAFDQGDIIAGDARITVCELELELLAGSRAALFRFALELHNATPLTIDPESKAARGERLRSGTAPEAVKAAHVTLTPKTTAAHAVRMILTTTLGHLLANQAAALAGNVEGIHQMRVAIRRLRAALTLFAPVLEPHATARFQDELRRVGRVFGEARDWDVFTLEVLPGALHAAGVTDWHDLLHDPASTHREKAHRHFIRELRAPAFTALLLGLAAWAESPHLLGGSELQHPVKDLCPHLLDRLARKVDRRGRHIRDRTDTERHALRKSLKKLRYGIDFLHALLPERSVEAYLLACKALQTTLGEINDTVTGAALADHLGDAGIPAADALAKQLGQQHQDGLDTLAQRWKVFHHERRPWA
jgi:inorganic triphosphatase YgiF